MKIGLYGGSFNPPHYGHLALAHAFKLQAKLDLVWILVVPEPSHKPGQMLAAYQHRLAMTCLLFDRVQGLEINRIEERLSAPHYTYQTIQALKAQYPDTSFYLCLGEDNLAQFMEWMKPDVIVDAVELLIAPRSGINAYRDYLPESWLPRIHFIDTPLLSVSSSQIRNYIMEEKSITEFVPQDIAEYIRAHKVYV